MKFFSADDWQVSLPEKWNVEAAEDCVDLYDDDGFGTLSISAALQDMPVTGDDLLAIAEEHLEKGADPLEVEHGDFDGFVLCYDAEEESWCEWYLKAGRLLLFVTYDCSVEDEGKEDDTVETILNSLRLRVDRE